MRQHGHLLHRSRPELSHRGKASEVQSAGAADRLTWLGPDPDVWRAAGMPSKAWIVGPLTWTVTRSRAAAVWHRSDQPDPPHRLLIEVKALGITSSTAGAICAWLSRRWVGHRRPALLPGWTITKRTARQAGDSPDRLGALAMGQTRGKHAELFWAIA